MADELDPQKAGEAVSHQSEAEKTMPPAPAESEESSQGTEAVPSGTEEGKEPRGADGESVYQQKFYRENKQLKEGLQAQAIEQARLAERLKLTEEILSKQQTTQAQPKIYSVMELEAAVELNQQTGGAQGITRVDAERYKDEVINPIKIQILLEQREKARQEQEAKEKPLIESRKNLGKYTQLHPWLADPTNTRTQEIVGRYNDLVSTYGLPQNEITSVLAISQVLGPIDKATQRREVDNLTSRNTGTFAEGSAGGTNGQAGKQQNINNAPATMKAYWEKAGLTQVQRQKEYQFYLQEKAQKR